LPTAIFKTTNGGALAGSRSTPVFSGAFVNLLVIGPAAPSTLYVLVPPSADRLLTELLPEILLRAPTEGEAERARHQSARWSPERLLQPFRSSPLLCCSSVIQGPGPCRNI
jgi:hypothetical protein